MRRVFRRLPLASVVSMWGGEGVGKKKLGHPCWFKLFDSHLELFEAAPPEAVKDGLCAALRYLTDKELPSLESGAQMIFMVLKRDLDLAWSTYEKKSEGGRRGNKTRWGMVSECDTQRYHPILSDQVVSDGIQKPRGFTRASNTAAPAVQGGERLVDDLDLGYLGVEK